MAPSAKDCLLALAVTALPLAVAGPLHLAGIGAEGPLAYGTFAFYLLASLWAVRARGHRFADIGLTREGLAMSLGLAAVLPAFVLITGALTAGLGWREPLGTPRTAERAVYCFLLSGPGQEILFRGLVLFSFLRWKGPAAALVASSALYGVAHLRGGLEGIAVNTVVGAWYGLAVLASRNVWGAAIVHGLHNFLFGYVIHSNAAVL